MTHSPHNDFSLEGEVLDFLLTLRGGWRMILKTECEEYRLRIAKPLREEMRAVLKPGTRVSVAGVIEKERFSQNTRRTVTTYVVMSAGADQLLGRSASACITCPIEVCAKKNCWKGGGKEIFQVLERELEQAGLAGVVKLKKVRCLDNCKRGPNVLHGKTLHERCRPEDATAIVAMIAGAAPAPGC